MTSATNMHTVSGITGGLGSSVASHFTKMDSNQYAAYLSAHSAWRAQVITVDNELHDQSIKRRALEKFREVHKDSDFVIRNNMTGTDVRAPRYTREVPIYHDSSDNTDVILEIRCEQKVAHMPTVSTKPHEAEKRTLKKEVAALRTKVQVESLKAERTILTNDENSAEILKRKREIKKLKDLAPLHKAEAAAAKSAAARSKSIKFGSTDLVPNIDTTDGFKVVTRKKGGNANIVQSSYALETVHDGVSGHPQSWTSWQTSQDPALPNVRKNISVNPRPRNNVGK